MTWGGNVRIRNDLSDREKGTLMDAVRGLDEPCGVCRRRSGDHTLDEWAACLGGTALDLPYEEVSGPRVIPLHHGGRDIPWGDHLVAKSCVIAGQSVGANLRVQLPAVIFTFQIGSSVRPPTDVAEVAYVGTPAGLRNLGRLLRDTCNGAANAAERTA